MKHMILSLKMKGDVISDHFLMLWLQKDSLDTAMVAAFYELPNFVEQKQCIHLRILPNRL